MLQRAWSYLTVESTKPTSMSLTPSSPRSGALAETPIPRSVKFLSSPQATITQVFNSPTSLQQPWSFPWLQQVVASEDQRMSTPHRDTRLFALNLAMKSVASSSDIETKAVAGAEVL